MIYMYMCTCTDCTELSEKSSEYIATHSGMSLGLM
jgi:hypothetical protein